MIGVILAGGKSTRFPHKLFLPQKERTYIPIISSAIKLCENNCETTYIVINRNDLNWLPDLLFNMNIINANKIKFIEDNNSGIPAAINLVANKHQFDKLFICCGDNIYDKIIVDSTKEKAFIKRVPLDVAKHLTIYTDNSGMYWPKGTANWHSLIDQQNKFYMALITPWLISACRFVNSDISGCTIEYLLSKWYIEPEFTYDDNKWFDIGTFESYERYLQC